jgi:NTP pyrophosphatase (non-canonical NTP hydrolase)
MAVACEAAELMELFQWLTPEESEAIAGAEDKMEAVRDEMADILIYLLRLADILQVDLGRAVVRKMDKNAVRFPTTARG